ncbi:RICIN domain-containing protein [Streptomyces sp. NPDC003006]
MSEPTPPVPPSTLPTEAMLIHSVTNGYLLPDNINDSIEDDEVEIQATDPLASGAAALWRITRLQSGFYRIGTTSGQRFLTVQTAAGYNANVRIRSRAENDYRQHWALVPVPGLSDTGKAPVRALIARGTGYALGVASGGLSLGSEVRLIRTWNGHPSLYHAWMFAPVSRGEEGEGE